MNQADINQARSIDDLNRALSIDEINRPGKSLDSRDAGTSSTPDVSRSTDSFSNFDDVAVVIDSDGAPPTGNGTLQQLADYLRVGYWTDTGRAARSWAGGNVTYNLTDLTVAEANLARSAMALWSSIALINFTETAGAAQITFNNDGSGNAGASSTVSGANLTAVTIGISGDWWPNDNYDEYMYQTYIHEIGHAIGLGHQGPYNNSATYPTNANWFNDSWRVSVMSYFSQSTAGTGTYAFVTGPQMSDIRALQDIYGARTTRTGNDTYGYNGTAGISYNFTALGSATSFTIYDSGGVDTIDGSGYNGAQTFDLRGGLDNASSVGGETNNISIWVNTVVENAIGGGGVDTFYGNTSNNEFTGNGGSPDTVVFNGNRSLYNFIETNSYTVTGNGQGTDTLHTIERFVFNDVTVTDDAIGGTNTTDTIAVNGSRNGEIQFLGDRDWYRVTLTGGQNYVFDLRGAPTAAGSLSDPYIYLYNSAGTLIASNDDGGIGFEAQLAVRVTTTGTYYLGARSFADVYLGTYRAELDGLGPIVRRFTPASSEVSAFTPGSGGWSNNNLYLRAVADINGDGLGDIVGFGSTNVFVALGNNNGFLGTVASIAGFAQSGGWDNNDLYTRLMGDINGDGRSDIVGFGYDGVFISLSSGGSNFADVYADLANFGPGAGGWSSNNIYGRVLGDVNGDNRDDIVAFSSTGVFVALAKTTGTAGFQAPIFATASFGTSAGSGGWSTFDRFPRTVADVNGDGRADIVAFGGDGVFTALGQANGTFGDLQVASSSFGFNLGAGGWTSNDLFPRLVQDVNNDGRADIVAFGGDYVYVALGRADGTFSPLTQDLAGYGANPGGGSWSSNSLYPRLLGDLSGDGRPEIIAFGYDQVLSSNNFDFVTV